MAAILAAILFALFLWWFSTGLILYLDRLPQRTFKWSMAGAAAVLAASFYGLWVSAGDASVSGAYLAFASALGVWAFAEISFYMGYLTGPRRHPCEEGCGGWRHFGHAVQVSLWHEILILASFALVLFLTWGGANRTGLWTFVILWTMHESARLNVFLGVRNLNAHFLPPHLSYLRSFLKAAPMNLLFPVSVTLATIVCAVLGAEAAFAADAHERVGAALLAAILGLAILEHWFLVLPIPAEALWAWSVRRREASAGGLGIGARREAARHRHDHHKPRARLPAARLLAADPERAA